ncbi:MAG: helix-turn-helix domain-containing protein [Pseudomonadota bacterium]
MYDVVPLAEMQVISVWVLLDMALRFSTAAITLLVIAHLIQMRRLVKTWTLIAALGLSALHLLDRSTFGSVLFGPLYGFTHWPFMLAPVLVVWACLDFFTDDFRPGRRHIAGAGVYLAAVGAGHLAPMGMSLTHLAEFGMYAYLFRTAICADKDDLVQSRRDFRRLFVIEVAVGCMFITGLVTYCQFNETPVWFDFAIAFIVFAIITTLTFWMLRIRGDLWPSRRVSAANKSGVAANGLSIAENALAVRLEQAIEGGVWREEGLTIRILAERLDAPEHRLRRVINQGLGYRNFSAFINERRVAAAAEAFANPDRADVPILTIAYESGFASLGPFNRAFRERMGQSPNDFRKQSLSDVFGVAD